MTSDKHTNRDEADESTEDIPSPTLILDFADMEEQTGEEVTEEFARDALIQVVKGQLNDPEKQASLVSRYPEVAPLTLERVHFDESEVVDLPGSEWAIKLEIGEPRTADRIYEVIGELEGASNAPTDPCDRGIVTYETPDGETDTITGAIIVDGGVSVEWDVLLSSGEDWFRLEPDGTLSTKCEDEDYERRTLGEATKLEIQSANGEE